MISEELEMVKKEPQRSIDSRAVRRAAYPAPVRYSHRAIDIRANSRDDTPASAMRGDRAGRDTRHNKDFDNLKSSLKKGNKSKKHRVVFDETANEFFEADYIIVVRDECGGFSDEGETDECSGCGACDRFQPQEPEPGALSPPEGYKDLSLFNRDGTLREQAWWEAGDVLLVGERSGTVFTPQHLQLLRRLQRERMLRSTICADCDAHAALHQPLEVDYGYEDEEGSDADSSRELRPVARRTGKHIAAGEERPRINSSQQTTPTDDCPEICMEDLHSDIPPPPITSEESDTGDGDGRHSVENSPLRQRRGGILKGGRLWKSSIDMDKEIEVQIEDRSTNVPSDEDGCNTPRSVRFVERRETCEVEMNHTNEAESANNDHEPPAPKEFSSSHRLDTPLILTNHAPKSNSAVQQLFNSSRPPPPSIEPHHATSDAHRAWDSGIRPRHEEVAVRRVAERNALRCSLLRSEARKKQLPKQETTSLTERIRLLTCDVDDEPEEERPTPAVVNIEKSNNTADKSFNTSDKSFNTIDRANEKAFGSASSSSSSSTLSTAVPTRIHPPDLAEMHHDHKPRTEHRRQFLPNLGPLTACVGGTAHHEGFYYMPPGDRTSASSATTIDCQDVDTPAPDVVAGTPGANDGDAGLVAFARATAPRTERLKQKYGQESQAGSSDDEHDDYGFHRRPAVRGIAIKKQLGTSEDLLQQMQNELQASPAVVPPQQISSHQCVRSNNYPWPYYSETLNSRPQSRASNANWSKADYVTVRGCSGTPVPQHSEACYVHGQSVGGYPHYQQRQPDAHYRNCSLYANVGCSDSSQELYSSQTSSEQTSPVRAPPRCRRPESPPPIRSHHQLLYVPYNSHYHYQHHYNNWNNTGDYQTRMIQYYQQQHQHPPTCSVANVPPPASSSQPIQRAQYAHALQALCPAPARYRAVPAPQPGGGKQMISYSEKVPAPLYQPAPGSPSRVSRGNPEGSATGAPASATSPVAPPPNPVYYAMNV